MKFKQIALFVMIGLFASTVWSGEQVQQKVKIEVIADDDDGETRLIIDSDDLDFNLHEMQVGENQSFVDKDGRAVLVTRTEDGFSFDVDGKTIEMPAFNGHHEKNVWISDDGSAPEVDVQIHTMGGGMGRHHGMAPRAMFAEEGVMIISGKKIDDATQQVIRTALESAGHESVHFAGGGEGGPHQVHVVKKVVEVEVTE